MNKAIKSVQIPSHAGSFRHGYIVPPPSRREAKVFANLQLSAETNFSKKIKNQPSAVTEPNKINNQRRGFE